MGLRKFEIKEIEWSRHDSPAGLITVASAGGRICFMGFPSGTPEHVEALLCQEFRGTAVRPCESSGLHVRALKAAFAIGGDVGIIPVAVVGTPFQQAVWRELATVSRGEMKSYSELAARVGHPAAVRAVASAVARNRIAPLIPCHRIIKASGEAGLYRWGAETKLILLRLEKLSKNDVGSSEISLDIVSGSLPGSEPEF